MNRSFAALLLTLVLANTAFGRLGETEKEITARFGEGQLSDIQRQTGAQTMKYFKNGFQIEVVISQGKSIWEIYHKQGSSSAFPEADIKNLLEAYKELKESKRTWRYDKKERRWESSGKPKLIGYLWPGHEDYFCIKDSAACDALDKSAPGSKGL